MNKNIELLYTNFNDAIDRLNEAINLNSDEDIIKEGIIKRFELTYLLTFRLLRDYLIHDGYDLKIGSEKELLNISYKEKLITDGDAWLQMVSSYEKIAKVYNSDLINEVYILIKEKYITLFKELNIKLIDIKE